MTSCDSVCETDLPCPSTLPDRKSARPVDTAIPDVQNTPDVRRIAIDKVGIKAIRHPVKVRDKSSGTQHTIATFGMYVHLPHHFKGTHMSRFIEILNSQEREITVESFESMLRQMDERLEARSGYGGGGGPGGGGGRAPGAGGRGRRGD